MTGRCSFWNILCSPPAGIILLMLPALQPLLTADFTCGYDNGFHLWRAVELEYLVRRGVLFSRWAPNMAHGYGYPLFNFAAPLSAYAVVLLHLLGLSWPWALNLTFAVGWVLSAYTMYLFVSDVLDSHAGMIAAVLYAYAPFHAYDVFYRGGLAQASAWLFPPLVLWGLRRAVAHSPAELSPACRQLSRSARLAGSLSPGVFVAALSFAGLVLTHNAFALLFTPVFLGYLIVAGVTGHSWRVFLQGVAVLLVGLGLSAFFWIPALTDLRYVHGERLSGAWVFEYRYNFLPPDQLFALPRTADPTLLNDWPERGLGLIPVLAALCGLSGWRTPRLRPLIAFFGGSLGCCIFLTLPLSRPVWDALPLLQQVQFPWRLVGPATLCAGFLAGILARPPFPRWSSLLVILLLILTHLGWFYPRHCAPPQDASVGGMIAWEHATDTIGTTAKGEYLPLWVERMPESDVPYASDGTAIRLAPESLPQGARVLRAGYRPASALLELETPVPFRAHYLAFYFPGWKVTVDGRAVPVSASATGLVSFDVPAGRHTVRIRFGESLGRLAADALSLISLVVLAGSVCLWMRGRHNGTGSQQRESGFTWYCIVAIGLSIIKIALLDRVETPLRRSNLADGRLRRVDVPLEITFGDEFVLLGHDTLPATLPGDGELEITTYWRALHPGGPDYGVTIHIVDVDGLHWQGPDVHLSRWQHSPPPAWAWPPDQYAMTVLVVPLLPGIPPGNYTVELVAFDMATLLPLTAHEADGRVLGPGLPLGKITVTAPRRAVAPTQAGLGKRLDVPLGPLTLLGATLDRETAAPGDGVLLTTLWQAREQPQEELTLRLLLADSEGKEAAAYLLPPTASWHPTTEWRTGQVWRGQHFLRLPAHLKGGEYRWKLELLPGGWRAELTQMLRVEEPQRLFEPWSVEIESGVCLGGLATLMGGDVEVSSGEMVVRLEWRAEGTAEASYHVFVHLVDGGGQLVRQSDGVPGGWRRPTTGWVAGEYVLDEHRLDVEGLPAGEYSVVVGLYEPGGARLRAADGGDAIVLTTLKLHQEHSQSP